MSQNAVFCIADSETQARLIVENIYAEGFPLDDISVIFSDRSGNKDLAHKKTSKAPEGATAGAGTGGLLGGTLGLLAGIGSLAIPGLGPFIAAGPIMAALSGAAVGAAVGGIAGGLVGMGIPEYEARLYEGKIVTGNILICVHAENNEEKDVIMDIYRKGNARDISATKEVAV
ncbi:MAG TPA: hypothetical protein VL688_00755 [Verrucomicrobiae bacterium]|jgi:hypothetical protein|nr:hypothetical protein [Verrucomicrobiae bacterium]